MGAVTFDGVVLSDRYTVLAKRGMSAREIRTEAVPGRDGVVVTGADYVPPTLSLVFVFDPTEDAPRAVRELSALLSAREPRRLEFGEDGGLYYMAVPQGATEIKVLPSGSSSVEVPFLVADAAMYGLERSVTVPSGGSVTFTVDGTYPTSPTIAASAAVRNASSGRWGLLLDDADAMTFALASNTSRTIAADCAAKTARVAGDVAIPTLDSDWLELAPGEHTLRMHQGTGAATVTWRERWLS